MVWLAWRGWRVLRWRVRDAVLLLSINMRDCERVIMSRALAHFLLWFRAGKIFTIQSPPRFRNEHFNIDRNQRWIAIFFITESTA